MTHQTPFYFFDFNFYFCERGRVLVLIFQHSLISSFQFSLDWEGGMGDSNNHPFQFKIFCFKLWTKEKIERHWKQQSRGWKSLNWKPKTGSVSVFLIQFCFFQFEVSGSVSKCLKSSHFRIVPKVLNLSCLRTKKSLYLNFWKRKSWLRGFMVSSIPACLKTPTKHLIFSLKIA